ncbi:SA1362 family protein [Aquibacillus saliphilus]|uniref:SA1362 family protein n=1 Tax=Aquibacillus saliphilus TaxID=1909422 RepID=UPI001CF089CC|nr:SA1362 family protein [Aquibacillus saliphilus]
MFRNKLSLLIYVLIGLAVLGFATQLLTNTASLLMNLLLMVVFGVIIYGVIYYAFLRKRSSNDIKKYKKAVKQSKMKYKKDQPSQKTYAQVTKKSSPLINKRKSTTKAKPTHLKVIDGNKPKRKNRASF